MIVNSTLKILVVEDNPTFAILVDLMLREIGITQLFFAKNYDEGLLYHENHNIDLCLVDIDLGDEQKTGIDLVEQIRKSSPTLPVIYLTSNYTEEYYLKSRHTRPSCFMNKELSRFKLQQAIDLAVMQVLPNIPATPVSPPPVITRNNFFFKVGDIYKSIPLNEIAYFFADQKLNYARVQQRNYPTTLQLRILEQEFSDIFIRIHKSYLVNIKFVDAINPSEGTVSIPNETLPVGPMYRKNLFDKIYLLK